MKNIKIIFLAFLIVCIDKKCSKEIVFYREKNAVNKFIKAILKEMECFKNVIKKDFNKNINMYPGDETEALNQVTNAGYVTNYLLQKIIKSEIMII